MPKNSVLILVDSFKKKSEARVEKYKWNNTKVQKQGNFTTY